MSSALGDKGAADAPEQDQFGNIMEMHEPAEVLGLRSNQHVLGDHHLAGRKLDRLTDRTERHGNILIVSGNARKSEVP
jgi:hypothetical protein